MNTDHWHQWLLNRRHAGGGPYAQFLQGRMETVRSRILDGAKLSSGMTLVDIGAGEGLVGFGAIEKIGPELRVIFTDLSAPLLLHVQKLASEKGVHRQCSFFNRGAENLDGLDDGIADAVAMRAVLAYVPDKPAAMREFYRILKPGGRVSIAESILQDQALENLALGRMIQSQPAHPQIEFLKLLHRYRAAQYPSTEAAIFSNPITNFSERDLLHLFLEAGFTDVHLELHIDHKQPVALSWEVCLDISPHPWAPTLREILDTKFSNAERQLFERGLRQILESDHPVTHESIAFVTAEKPLVPIRRHMLGSGS